MKNGRRRNRAFDSAFPHRCYTIEVFTEKGSFDDVVIQAVQRAATRLKANIGLLAKTDVRMYYDDAGSVFEPIPEILPEDGAIRDE